MTKNPLSQLEESRKALKNMTVDLQKVAAAMRSLARKERHGVIRVAREQGALVDVVVRGEAKYGTNAVELLASHMGIQPDWLYKLKRVYNAFYEEDMEVFYQHGKNKDAKALTLSHLILLSSVTGEKASVMKLAKKTMDKHWTVVELRSAIAKAKGPKPPSQISIPGGIQKVLKLSLIHI